MDMRSLLLATRPQRQGLLQAGAMAMAATHEQAINQSWAQVRESTAQAQCPHRCNSNLAREKNKKEKGKKISLFFATSHLLRHWRRSSASALRRSRRRRRRIQETSKKAAAAAAMPFPPHQRTHLGLFPLLAEMCGVVTRDWERWLLGGADS